MEQELKKIQTHAREAIRNTADIDLLEQIRVKYVGRKGALTAILRRLKDLPLDGRKKIGDEANRLAQEIERLISEKHRELDATARETILQKERLDVTRPGARAERGHMHPVTKMLAEIERIFHSMGFETTDGPEVETDFYNFQALNMPPGHPARSMWDTFWLRQDEKQKTKDERNRLLLRTHISPVQVRYMETHNPPIRIIVPGRSYRYEATDASHDFQFEYIEGLVVDKNISVANFKAIMIDFFSRLFKKQVTVRLRPSYFPFTEPSFEIDVSCAICNGKGCSMCKRTGWLELAGAGMVHPNVFKAAGYNPKNVQGFAFGIGFSRLVSMRYNIPDIRLLNSGDLRFLKQF
ncbi:MAG: phenylalanine--tRNA ligase subunit alpha [Candidatus Sungbacteria bacterium]|nr:phenylalanine--tRNA ligase subunit alpha [Candidatus Sungbacteria bacterium]